SRAGIRSHLVRLVLRNLYAEPKEIPTAPIFGVESAAYGGTPISRSSGTITCPAAPPTKLLKNEERRPINNDQINISICLKYSLKRELRKMPKFVTIIQRCP